MWKLKAGDRVEHADNGHQGTVGANNSVGHVQVQWDDGQVGLLEFKRDVNWSAYKLLKLVDPAKVKNA